MIDFHNHILPDVDDGPKTIEESLKMLSIAAEQGITDIVNTVHFQHPKMHDKNVSYDYLNNKVIDLQNHIDKENINIYEIFSILMDNTEYFNLIDVPSFVNHLSLYFNNYDLIVDNTSYLRPIIKNKEYPRLWMSGALNKKLLAQNNLDKFIKKNEPRKPLLIIPDE